MKKLTLLFLLIPFLGFSQDTIPVKNGENFILLPDKFIDGKISNSDVLISEFYNVIKLSVKTDEDFYFLISCENNKNSLVYFKHDHLNGIYDARNLHFSPDLKGLEKTFNDTFNITKRYNSRTAYRTLEKITKTSETSSFVSFNKKDKLGLILTNDITDYQLRYYSFAVINNSEETFNPGLIKIFKKENDKLTEIFPLIQTHLEIVESKSKGCFAFALEKSFNEDLTIHLKNYNNTKRVELIITKK